MSDASYGSFAKGSKRKDSISAPRFFKPDVFQINNFPTQLNKINKQLLISLKDQRVSWRVAG